MIMWNIFIWLWLACLSTFCNGLEHQWVDELSSLGAGADALPVLHTAFVQTGEELHFIAESLRQEDKKAYPRTTRQEFTKHKDSKYVVKTSTGEDSIPLQFDPPFIDFGDSPVGVPLKQKVFVRSQLKVPISLESISGNTANFHSSFFNVLELSDSSGTWFEIAFLPREETDVATTLYITTSVGVFLYEVKGRSDSNPYRLPPFVGIRLAFNATTTRPIVLHNPHAYTLRIYDISSSGGNAHVELPHDIDSGVSGEPVQYWDIRPYQTRTVGKTVIVGHTVQNSTAFIRISAYLLGDDGKRRIGSDPVELVLNNPFEVTRQGGIFLTNDLLDFGMLRQGERSQHQTLSVYQYNHQGKLEFETLYVDKGDALGIYMEFASNPPIAVFPGKNSNSGSWPGRPADLVKVFFDASRVVFDSKLPALRHFNGRIIAVSRGGNFNVTIPFKASVYQGELGVVGNDLAIQENLRPPHRRAVRLVNRLPFSVAVWNVSLAADATNYFTLRLFEKATVLGKGEERPVFLLKYNKRLPETMGTSYLYVHTNVSSYRILLNKYSGKTQVELFTVAQDQFDYGLLERNDSRTIRFAIRNLNRALMTVRGFSVPDLSLFRLYLVGLFKNDQKLYTSNTTTKEEWMQDTDLEISADHMALFDMELRAPDLPHDFSARKDLVIATDYETKVYPVIFKLASGRVYPFPDKISFGITHPGKVAYKNLHMFNQFDEDLRLERLSTSTRDPRFHFETFDPAMPPVLKAGRLTNLGRVMFMPEAPCSYEYCYLGLPLHTTDGQWFVHGLTLPGNLAEIDSYLYKRQRSKFDQLVKSGRKRVNTTIVVDTDKVKNIKVPASAEMVWPRLLTRNSVHFPLTALGNFTIMNLTLHNPTSVPIVVQVIPLVIYPDADAVVDAFRAELLTPLTQHVEMNETLMFSLRDTELFSLKWDSPVPKLREELENAIGRTVPRFTLSLLLKPHMNVRLRVGFLPSDYELKSSLLLIRNNLTGLEPVVMYGRGGRIGMRVEDTEARSRKPLLFEIRHDHLTDCSNPKRLMHKLTSTLTVRRPFVVSNTGEVPFTVVNMSINGVSCENRGFRILNCFSFSLQPNETYQLEIAFTPDFLTTTNEADLQLYMHMNGSSWLFPLAATVPTDQLSRCHRALPRPPFENLMYYSCVTALVFCLVCVLACAYLEGDRAIACAIRQHYGLQRPVFDLNNLELSNSNQQQQQQQSQNKRVWPDRSPAGLHARPDSSTLIILFYGIANRCVKLVHIGWKWTLKLRCKETVSSERLASTKKKRKTQISIVNSKANESKKDAMSNNAAVQKTDATLVKGSRQKDSRTCSLSPSPCNTTTTTPPTVSGSKQNGSAAQTKKTNNNNKLSSKLSCSPRAVATTKSDVKKNNSTVPSRNAEERGTDDRNMSEKQMKREADVESKRVKVKDEKKRPKPATKLSLSSPKTVTATVTPVLSSPVTVSIPPGFGAMDLDYQMSVSPKDSGRERPHTPTPSLASFGIDQLDERSCDDRSRDASTSRCHVSDQDLSDVSDEPDWMGANITGVDADEDFGAMAMETEKMNTRWRFEDHAEGGDDGENGTTDHEESRNLLLPGNANLVKRRRRGTRTRGSRKTRAHNVTSESESASDGLELGGQGPQAVGFERRTRLKNQLQQQKRQMEEEYRRMQNSVHGWPMPDLPLGSLLETEERPATMALNALWPPSPTQSALQNQLFSQWSSPLLPADVNAHADMGRPLRHFDVDPRSMGHLDMRFPFPHSQQSTSTSTEGGLTGAVDDAALFLGASFRLWSDDGAQGVFSASSWPMEQLHSENTTDSETKQQQQQHQQQQRRFE